MSEKNDWNRLSDGTYVGGAVRETDDKGRTVHRRIAKVTVDDFAVAFSFDRVAVRAGGAWRELPLEDNDFLWFPSPIMPLAVDGDGVARPGSEEFPSFIEGIYPKTALPADSPAFDDRPLN